MDTRSPDAACIILYNNEGKMLLEHRTETRKRYPGYWALFGGRPDEGETPLQTVLREAKEEMGYALKNPFFLYAQDLTDGKKYIFLEKYDGVQEIVLDPHESQGFGWFTLEECRTHNQIPHDYEPLERAAEYIKKATS